MVHRTCIYLPVIGTCVVGPGEREKFDQYVQDAYDAGYTEDGRKVTGGATVVFLRAHNRDIVIETGDYKDQKTLLENKKRMGLTFRDAYLMATHSHPDHIGNHSLFCRCKGKSECLINLYDLERKFVEGIFSDSVENYATKYRWIYEKHIKDGMTEKSISFKEFEDDFPIPVKVISTVGHSTGHVSILVEEPSDIIFPGGQELHVKGSTVIAGDAIIARSYLAEFLKINRKLSRLFLASRSEEVEVLDNLQFDYSKALYPSSMLPRRFRKFYYIRALEAYNKILNSVDEHGIILPGHDLPIFGSDSLK